MAQIDLKNATITIMDGTTPTANALIVKIGEGNLTFTERRNIEYTLDRGLIDEVREGDQVPMEVSMDFVWEYLSSVGATTPTIKEALKQEGSASDWTSTDADVCRPYAVDVVIAYDPDCGGSTTTETITLPDFRHEEIGHDLREGTMACSGRCNAVAPIAVRGT